MTHEPEDTVENLLKNIEQGWTELQNYIDQLSETQMARATDSDGWSVKDHLIHLAVWEGGVYHLLIGNSRLEAMKVDQQTWQEGTDVINAMIFGHHEDTPAPEVLTILRDIHQNMIDHIATMSDADLQKPYNAFDPNTDNDKPIWHLIVADTYDHYQEHIPWMKQLADGS